MLFPENGAYLAFERRETFMASDNKSALSAAGSAGAGAIAGAVAFKAVGGIGVAAGGTAFGLTVGPFIAIGAGVGAVGYGLYWLGKQVGRKDREQQ